MLSAILGTAVPLLIVLMRVVRLQVDVTSADVEGLVRLTKGGVEVYLDDETKPPVGQGFNRPARVS